MPQHTPAPVRDRIVAEFRASGMTAAAFARVRGVPVRRLRRWHRDGRSAPSAAPPAPSFIELRPVEPSRPAASTAADDNTFRVRVGPFSLTFDAPPPAMWFAELVAELGSC